jgi:hypothetical protein
MRQMSALKKVVLTERHLSLSRTKHTLSDSQGRQKFPPFVSLAITHCPEDSGFFLMHICENGQVADTWHLTLEDAFQQAEFEFEVKPDEWTDTNEPF